MMKNLFLIVFFVACGLDMQAQEAFSGSEKNRTSSEASQSDERLDYCPMLVDGKSWRYLSHHFEDEADGSYTETTSTYENILDGDTLIGDVSYRKMYARIIASGERYYDSAWREDAKKVYKIGRGETEPELLFNFDMAPGEMSEIAIENRTYFSYVDTIAVNGSLYLRHHFTDDLRGMTGYYVEGIGGVDGLWPFALMMPTCICDYSTFLGVYENDKCIFSPEDFGKERYTDGIGLLVDDESSMVRHDGGVYDLQGRLISDKKNVNSGQLPRGIYIQNGRKFVIK